MHKRCIRLLSVFLLSSIIVTLFYCSTVYRNGKPHFLFLNKYRDVYERVDLIDFGGYPATTAYHIPVDINSLHPYASIELLSLEYDPRDMPKSNVELIPAKRCYAYEGDHVKVQIWSGVKYDERGRPIETPDPNSTTVLVVRKDTTLEKLIDFMN